MTPEQLERRVRFLSAYAGVLTLFLVVLLFGAFSYATRFNVIQAERIEVLGADGQPDLIIAGEGYMPGPVVEGREFSPDLSAGRTETAGIVFFNARGDEAGGLIYGGGQGDSTREAFGALKFDQYQQDQVVGLQYSERGGVRRAGVDVWDRPTNVPVGLLLRYAEAQRAGDRVALDSLGQVLARATGGDMSEQSLTGAHRAFFGAEDGAAVLRLEDGAGRSRIRMAVDATGTARLEFLDETGAVVHRLPEE